MLRCLYALLKKERPEASCHPGRSDFFIHIEGGSVSDAAVYETSH